MAHQVPIPGLPPTLARLVAERRRTPVAAGRCELCGVDLEAEHRHIVQLEARALLCACRACHLLFQTRGAAQGRYLSVPDRYEALTGVRLDTAAWESLGIPVHIACVFRNSVVGRVIAVYPGPAGATESLLPLDTWPELVAAHPALASIADDVEALLVRRRNGALEWYAVPIDACYELVGRLRRSWRGFQGGDEAWRDVDAFFARVEARSGRVPQGAAR